VVSKHKLKERASMEEVRERLINDFGFAGIAA
jgi:hypothetical protein